MSVPGSSVLTDNWLLQNAAGLLARHEDPFSESAWFDVTGQETSVTSVPLGAIQVHCVAALLEQIVLCDTLHVLEGFTDTWSGKLGALDALTRSGAIRPISKPPELRTFRAPYYEVLNHHAGISRHLTELRAAYSNGRTAPLAQVLDGTVTYVGIADALGLTYCPHPVRGRFLEQTLWYPSWPSPAVAKLTSIIDSTRLKLRKSASPSIEQTSATYSLPAIALLCLSEASQQRSAADIAVELRDEPDVMALRSTLSEVTVALDDGLDDRYRSLARELDNAAREVERRLALREPDARDGPSTITICKLPVRVPSWGRAPVRQPKHTGVLMRFSNTGLRDAKRAIANGLGLRDAEVLRLFE